MTIYKQKQNVKGDAKRIEGYFTFLNIDYKKKSIVQNKRKVVVLSYNLGDITFLYSEQIEYMLTQFDRVLNTQIHLIWKHNNRWKMLLEGTVMNTVDPNETNI